GSYIGWATESDINALASHLDRLYVHAYVPQPSQAYDYIAARVQSIAKANAALGKHVEVAVIYSAEGSKWAAGNEHFMGDWLSTNSLGVAETTFLSDWSSKAPATVTFVGFQYYEYFFLKQYVP